MADQLPTLDPGTKRARYEALFTRLKSERSSFDSHWRELADFLVPRRARWYPGDRNRGDKRNQNIIDSTARFSVRTLQSGLHAGLTSPARPWMKLTTPDPDLASQGNVKTWLHLVTQRMLAIFENTNLYNMLPIVYGDMGVFATAAMSVLDDSKDLFRAYAYPIGSYVLGTDARGLVSTFGREYQLTVRQVVEQFGVVAGTRDIDWSTISLTVRRLWDTAQYEAPVEMLWMVLPNEDYNPKRLEAKFFPWKSCHFERGSSMPVFLRESGFREFPVMAPRWDITGEDSYGTDCPGMTALGDVKQLQIMQREKGKAIAKMVSPPLVGPTSLMGQKTSLLPGDVTYVDVREGMQGFKAVHDISLNVGELVRDISATQYRIQRAFYEDLFLMLAQHDDMVSAQPVTAREIDERHEEKLLALGPVLERTNDELLDPLVDRVYAMMARAKLLPDPPDALVGVALKVEYTSIMAQAQKLVGVGGQDRLLQTLVPLVATWPEVREKLDPMQLVDNYGEMLGVDPRVIRTTEIATQRVAAIQKQNAAAAQAEQTAQLATAAKNAAAAPLDGNTALSALVGNVTGAGAGAAALGGA